VYSMCGIFGSYDFKTYESLYNENKKRGTFAYGSLYIKNTLNPGFRKEVFIRKRHSTRELTGDYAFTQDYESFLGHTQAPTGSQRKYSPYTTHPFPSMYYHVAHNGVLENTSQLIEEFIGPHDNPVDSSIIPILISYMLEFEAEVEDIEQCHDENIKTPELRAVENVCSMLKGTFGCWIYSKLTGDTYLVRSGSTLYGNITTGDFSSIVVPGRTEEELREGLVYCVTSEGLAECGEFEPSSPFFL